MKPCNDGQRHKWAWLKNRTVLTQTIATKTYSLKGVYRCEKCGASKYGQSRIEPEAPINGLRAEAVIIDDPLAAGAGEYI